ncbi:MAG: HAD-IA family hydrolase [Alphaproteobacteria bacterium]
MTGGIQPRTPIRAVLWDFGGVFTTSPFEAFNRYEAQASLPQDFIRTLNSLNSASNAWAKLERGEISIPQFCRNFEIEARDAGQAVDGAAVLKCIHGELRQEMVTALRVISKRYKTACLTNNFGSTDDTSIDSDAIKEVMKLFDVVIESSMLGFRKPEIKFYEHACELLVITPKEAVFLDDLGVNLKPARAMGMHTIKVVSPTQALNDLQDCLGHNVM